MQKICYIVGASTPGEVYITSRRPSVVIAADGGLACLETGGVAHDLVIGDFDSLGRVPEGDNVIRYPVEKDDTDSMLAVKRGLSMGCRDFVLYGCLGGRMDHTYANFQTMAYLADRGGRGYLLGEGWCATVIRESSLTFPEDLRGTVSVFCPDGEAEGVTIRGLLYEMEEGSLRSGFPLGVSNSFTGERATVAVKRGSLLVMWQEEPKHLVDRL